MKEKELMRDFDGEKHGNRFCEKQGCRMCFGKDLNGEPNGYGCDAQEKYEQSRYDAILKRRLKKQVFAKLARKR